MLKNRTTHTRLICALVLLGASSGPAHAKHEASALMTCTAKLGMLGARPDEFHVSAEVLIGGPVIQTPVTHEGKVGLITFTEDRPYFTPCREQPLSTSCSIVHVTSYHVPVLVRLLIDSQMVLADDPGTSSVEGYASAVPLDDDTAWLLLRQSIVHQLSEISHHFEYQMIGQSKSRVQDLKDFHEAEALLQELKSYPDVQGPGLMGAQALMRAVEREKAEHEDVLRAAQALEGSPATPKPRAREIRQMEQEVLSRYKRYEAKLQKLYPHAERALSIAGRLTDLRNSLAMADFHDFRGVLADTAEKARLWATKYFDANAADCRIAAQHFNDATFEAALVPIIAKNAEELATRPWLTKPYDERLEELNKAIIMLWQLDPKERN